MGTTARISTRSHSPKSLETGEADRGEVCSKDAEGAEEAKKQRLAQDGGVRSDLQLKLSSVFTAPHSREQTEGPI